MTLIYNQALKIASFKGYVAPALLVFLSIIPGASPLADILGPFRSLKAMIGYIELNLQIGLKGLNISARGEAPGK